MINRFIDEYLKNYKNYKENWNYEDGCVLKGAWDLYKATGEEKFRTFVSKYMDTYIDKDGNIKGFDPQKHHLDDINSGKVLFNLYEVTQDERYSIAISHLYEQIRTQPRTVSGNFWHKDIYPNQIWLDGLYMVMPFYIRYEKCFGSMERVSDIYNQFISVWKLMRSDEKNLYYHGYDESRKEAWSDKKTGLSQNFWGRAEGWFVMALIDVLEEMDKDSLEQYKKLINIFEEAINGLLIYQDSNTGMWYQVLDKGGQKDNYPETSATLMIAYSILKGSRLGVLPENYRSYGLKAFEGTIKKYLLSLEGKFRLGGICRVAGLGNTPYRDGSYVYYIGEKVAFDDPKGVGALLMCYSEALRS